MAEQGRERGLPRYARAWPALEPPGLRHAVVLAGLTGRSVWQSGQTEEGLTVAEALALVDNEERYCEAELYRLKGELTLTVNVEESSKTKQDKAGPSHPSTPTPKPKPRRVFSKPSPCPKATGEVAGTAGSDELGRLWQGR